MVHKQRSSTPWKNRIRARKWVGRYRVSHIVGTAHIESEKDKGRKKIKHGVGVKGLYGIKGGYGSKGGYAIKWGTV